MTRQHRDLNPLGVAICAAAVIGLVLLVAAFQKPELFLWYLGIGAVIGLLGLGLVAAEARAEAKGLRDQLRAEREAAAAQRGDVVRVPLLRVVPTQRTGEHDRLAMSAEEWAAIERETEGF